MLQFENSDSWIFLSIARGHNAVPPTLDKVIWVADSINKLVPSRSEIENAVNRLSSVGLIRVEGNCFIVTELGHSILQQVCHNAKTAFDEWSLLKEFFRITSLPETNHSSWQLSERAFADADELYRKEFWKAYKILKQK
jgi:hypothetical protein